VDYPHQPNYLGSAAGPDGTTAYTFTPFLVCDREPRPLADRYTPEPYKSLMEEEYRAAHDQWAAARFLRDGGGAVIAAARTWAAWTDAASQLDFAWLRLHTVPADRWAGQVLAVVEAQDAVQAAALDWDYAAAQLLRLRADLASSAPASPLGLADAAARVNVDISGWHIGRIEEASGYYVGNLTEEIQARVSDERDRIRRASDLAGIGFDITEALGNPRPCRA
jgi:hypothetical protein